MRVTFLKINNYSSKKKSKKKEQDDKNVLSMGIWKEEVPLVKIKI